MLQGHGEAAVDSKFLSWSSGILMVAHHTMEYAD